MSIPRLMISFCFLYQTMVGLMGAQFSKPLVANKVTHLICYKFEGMVFFYFPWWILLQLFTFCTSMSKVLKWYRTTRCYIWRGEVWTCQENPKDKAGQPSLGGRLVSSCFLHSLMFSNSDIRWCLFRMLQYEKVATTMSYYYFLSKILYKCFSLRDWALLPEDDYNKRWVGCVYTLEITCSL